MSDNMRKLEDDLLEGISGGTELKYEMENDPLYRKFTSFWNDNSEKSGSGMDSRAEFMNAFRQWVSDGVPENISGWYNSFKKKAV